MQVCLSAYHSITSLPHLSPVHLLAWIHHAASHTDKSCTSSHSRRWKHCSSKRMTGDVTLAEPLNSLCQLHCQSWSIYGWNIKCACFFLTDVILCVCLCVCVCSVMCGEEWGDRWCTLQGLVVQTCQHGRFRQGWRHCMGVFVYRIHVSVHEHEKEPHTLDVWTYRLYICVHLPVKSLVYLSAQEQCWKVLVFAQARSCSDYSHMFSEYTWMCSTISAYAHAYILQCTCSYVSLGPSMSKSVRTDLA